MSPYIAPEKTQAQLILEDLAATNEQLRAKLAIAVEALVEARDRFDCLQDYESTGTFMARTGFREIEKALATINENKTRSGD